MPESKAKTYAVVPSGPLLDFDLSMVDEAWTGKTGAGKLEPGIYEWRILQMIKDKKYHAVVFNYVGGPGDETHEDWQKRTQMMFFHLEAEKKAANFYYGFLGQVCPWCLWPGFMPPPDARTGKSHFWPDWFTGGIGGVGARVKCSVLEEERNGKTQAQLQQGTIELVEPSSFAKGLLAVAGVTDWRMETPPPTMQQIGQLFNNPQQVALAVSQGLAAIGQMPMVNLGGVTAPQFQAPQRQKPIA